MANESTCKHKKWCKWQILNTRDGIQIQTRSCKKCGWSESKTTELYSPTDYKSAIKDVVVGILKQIEKDKDGTNS